MDYSKNGITITNKSGKEIRLEKYDKLDLESFCNGFTIVSIGRKYGFINENGKELCPIEYDMCWAFRENNKPTMVKLNGKYGLLDRKVEEPITVI